jgi:MarR family transcriptional regulator, transcriptional regulator for hemolysin
VTATNNEISLQTAPGAPAPEGNLGWLLSVTSHALATEMHAALESLNVTPRAHCVLSTACQGEFTQTELAQAVGLDKTTMVATVDELERAGLAERRPSAHDRRARVIAVTDAGREMVAAGEKVVADKQDEILASLPEDQRKVLIDALTSLLHDRLAVPAHCASSAPRRRANR